MDSKEQRIKVAIVINDFLVGGAQKLIVDMLRHADHQKFHYTLVTLFSFSDRKDFYQNLPKGIQLHRLSWKGFRDFRSWRKFYRVLKTIRPDVVISHLFFANTVSRILKIFLGYKVISFEHNTYTGKSRFQIWTDRLLAHLTFRIVAVSQSVKEFTAQQENIPLEKFKVILNGIDLTQISDVIGSCEKNELRKALNLPQEDTIIINVARLTAQKNQPALIEGFARFLKERPHYTLIILGEGSLKSRLEQRIKELGLSGKILLLGVRENIYHYYCASDFFISPSFIEGFGIAHAEALACGLPLLSTKTAGPDRMIEEGRNGYFIKGFDAEDIYEALRHIGTIDLAGLKAYARKSAQQYDIRKTTLQLEQLISDAFHS